MTNRCKKKLVWERSQMMNWARRPEITHRSLIEFPARIKLLAPSVAYVAALQQSAKKCRVTLKLVNDPKVI